MKKEPPSTISEFFARGSATDAAHSILTDPDLSALDILDRAATAILQSRAELRTGYRAMGHEPPHDDDGYEARALRIREHVTLARDAVRRGDAQQAVEYAITAASWLSDLQMLDMDPGTLEAIRESIRLSGEQK